MRYEKITAKYHGTGVDRTAYLITADSESKKGVAEFVIKFDKNTTRNGESYEL